MRVLSEFVEKKEVKKTRSRLKQADQVRKNLQLLDFEPNQVPEFKSCHCFNNNNLFNKLRCFVYVFILTRRLNQIYH